MAVTFPVVTKITGSNTNSITSSSFTSVAGSAMTVASSADSGVTINTPTNTNSDAFGTAKSNLTISSIRGAIWEKDNVNGGAGTTVTITYSAPTYPTAYVTEARGVAAAAYDSGAANFGTSSSGNPFNRPTLGQAQAANGIATFCFTDAGTISGFTCSGYTVVEETDTNNFWCGACGTQVVNTTSAVAAAWNIAPGASSAITFTIALKEAAAPSTFDVAESSAGTEASNRSVALTPAGAESSAGTDAANRTVAVAPGGVAETSAGTEAEDRTLAVGGAVAESSAGTEAANRTIAIAAAVSESSAGTTAQDATVAVGPLAVSESSAGATAQDFTFGNTFDAAESSTPSTAQDATVALAGTVAEASTPSTAQDRTIAVGPLAVNESSVGTATQDFAPASFDVAEASTPSTTQDRTLAPLPARAVAESSTPSTAQDRSVVPPAGLAQSGVRRWVVAYYEDYFAQKEREKKAEQPRKKTRAKSKSAKIIAPVQQMRQVEEHVLIVQRDREQAELDDEELLLLSAL